MNSAYSVVGLFGGTSTQFIDIPFNETDTTPSIQRGNSSGIDRHQRVSMDRRPVLQQLRIHLFGVQRLGAARAGSLFPVGSAAANLNGIAFIRLHNPYHIKQYAVFGEGTYAITDALKLTAGLRFGTKFQQPGRRGETRIRHRFANAAPTYNSF